MIFLGINPIVEILKKRPKDVRELIILENYSSKKINEVLTLAKVNKIHVHYQNKKAMDAWVKQRWRDYDGYFNYQGVAAEVQGEIYRSFDTVLEDINHQEKSLVLLLDEIVDPHNLGSLIRSAACLGADAVIIQKQGAASVTPTVIKVASGATEHISICRVANIQYAMEKMKNFNFRCIGLSLEAKKSIVDLDGSNRMAIVIGNEERGLKNVVQKACEELAMIPMEKGLDSLNASVAGALALFEIKRKMFM